MSSELVTCSLALRVKDKAGLLSDVLAKLKTYNLNLTSINSTTTTDPSADYEFNILFTTKNNFDLAPLKKDLESESYILYCHLASSKSDEFASWFPRQLRDLDAFAEKVLSFGMELDADHPGFKDPAYRKRRSEITEKAKTYRSGLPLPHVDYTADELKTWHTVYTKLTALFPTHACHEHQQAFPLLVRHCGYGPDNIPQIQDISIFLKSCTGFTLRPVMGLLSSRDFLNGLAFRVFHSTQYIRHSSRPLYTPEPDVCHELLGHVPMFANADFADFSQEIGLASLGASDDDIKKLATLYWFTVEFGVTQEGDKIKAYGAGLLSSFGELEYSVSDKPRHIPMDPWTACETKYPITEYQPLYYVTESFKKMKSQVREFSKTLKRPYGVRYNPYTESIEVLDSHLQITKFIHDIHGDMEVLLDSLDLLQIK